MSVRSSRLLLSFVFAAVLSLQGTGERALARQPVTVDGSTFDLVDGKFTGKVKGVGGGVEVASGEMSFGFAPDSVCQLAVDGANFDLDVAGIYARDARNRVVVTVDTTALLNELESLFISIVTRAGAVVDPATVVAQIDRLKFKVRDKETSTDDKVKVVFLAKYLVMATVDSVPGEFKAKAAFKGKAVRATGAAGDTTAPGFLSSVPADAAVGVSINTTVTATFDEPLSPATVNDTAVLLSGGGSVNGTVTYDDATRTVTFTPAAALAEKTLHTMTLTGGLADRYGNTLGGAPVTFSFTTEDITPPTVTGRTPPNGSTGVVRNTSVTVTFDEAMSPGTITTSTFTLAETIAGTPVVTNAPTYDPATFTATLVPTSQLSPNLDYTVTVTTLVQDAAGNGLAANEVWSFQTGAASDSTPPVISLFSPGDLATDVNVATHQVIGFSEPMNKASAEAAVSVNPTPVNPLQFFWNGAGDTVTVVFDTQAPVGIHGDDLLVEDTAYTVTVDSTAEDLAGNPKGTNDAITWNTQVDVTSPQVTGFTPDITAAPQTFSAASTLTVAFDEPMETVFSNVNVRVENGSDNRFATVGSPPVDDMTAAWSGNDLVITFINTGLEANSLYRVEIFGAADLAGNSAVEIEVPLVTTGSQTGNPTVMVTAPANGATGVSPEQVALIAFSRPMGPDLTSHVQITGAGTTEVEFERAPEPRLLLVTPKKAWPASSTITITVTGGASGATDASGNTLAGDVSFSFTTTAHNTNSWGFDGDYSTLKDGLTDVQSDRLAYILRFRDTATNLVFPGTQDAAAKDVVTLREQATGIPVKGYEVHLDLDGEMEILSPGNTIVTAPLAAGTTYELVLDSTNFKSSTGVPISPTVIPFTTATGGGNRSPMIFDSPATEDVQTVPTGFTLKLGAFVQDADGNTVTVDAQSDVDVAFSRTLTDSGFGNFNYETTLVADETDISSRNQVHPITFTIGDGAGGHTVTVKRDVFAWDVADVPTIVGPSGNTSSTPLYRYTLSATALAQAEAVILRVEDSLGNVHLFTATPVPSTTSGSFQHPTDNPLPPGDYILMVAIVKFDGASARGEFLGLAIGMTGLSTDFTVP